MKYSPDELLGIQNDDIGEMNESSYLNNEEGDYLKKANLEDET